MSTVPTSQLIRAALIAAALLGAVLPGRAQDRVPFPEDLNHADLPTFSESREFKVGGSDAYTRGIYCDFATETRRNYLKLMRQDKKLKFPVIIDLWPAPGNRVRGYPVRHLIVVHPTHYSPTVRVALCESFRFEYLREELVRFFLLEDALRRYPNASELIETRKDGLIPQWLWAGVSEAIGFREEGEPSELFAAVFRSGKIMGVDEILRADPDEMTTLSRAVYRASAGGLVLTLLQQDGGAARLQNFIAALASAPLDQEALLRKYFPGVGDSNNSLDKWWALQAAQLAKPTSLDVLPIAETEARLAQALTVTVLEDRHAEGDGEPAAEEGSPPRRRGLQRLFGKRGDEPVRVELPVGQEQITYRLDDYANFLGRADFAELVHPVELQLVQLSYRSFPLYRPLIQNYMDLIAALKDGDTEGAEASFAALAETRAGLLRSGQLVDDVLNFYQATESDRASGAFDDYHRLAERLRRAKPERGDELSKYLDRVQAEREK